MFLLNQKGLCALKFYLHHFCTKTISLTPSFIRQVNFKINENFLKNFLEKDCYLFTLPAEISITGGELLLYFGKEEIEWGSIQ